MSHAGAHLKEGNLIARSDNATVTGHGFPAF
jgi:hypothetical protein